MKEQLIEFVSDIISVPAEDIQGNPASYGIGSPDAWDSLAHMAIMTEMEDLLGQEISVSEMEAMDDLQKILNRLPG